MIFWKGVSPALLSVFLLLNQYVPTVRACDFCPDDVAWENGSYGPLMSKGSFPVEDGATCDDIYDKVWKLSNDHADCKKYINKHRHHCCYPGGTPAPQTKKPPTNNGNVQADGVEPVCHICGRQNIVPKANVVVFSNYIPGGSASCKSLYNMGLSKNIKEPICYPLQLYSVKNCGCTPTDTPASSPPPPPPAPQPQPSSATFPPRRERPPQNKSTMKLSLLDGVYRCRGDCRRSLEELEDHPENLNLAISGHELSPETLQH